MADARKIRLDSLLVERGLAESREQAKRLILAGKVRIQGVDNPKPGAVFSADIFISSVEGERFVSRGGLKLEAALKKFGVEPEGRVCADIGASTGGFTDCLVQNGAAKVYCVDVGVTQLHEKMRRDPRVIVMDHTNARDLGPGSFPEPVELAVMDVSFISSGRILPALATVCGPGVPLVLLIKPQFEAGRVEVSRGRGVIRDPDVHRRVISEVLESAEQHGWSVTGLMASPVTGGSGNREFLACFYRVGSEGEKTNPAGTIIDIDAIVGIHGS